MSTAFRLLTLMLGLPVQVLACAIDESEFSLGGVTIGQTEQSVREALGAPRSRIDTGEGWELRYDGLLIWVGYPDDESVETRTRRVIEILSTSDRYCTPSGICPGDSVSAAHDAYCAVEATRREDATYLEYGSATSMCWLQMLPDDGKIKSIRVECQP